MKIRLMAILVVFVARGWFFSPIVRAAPPTGNVELADATSFGGWARDDDFAGPIPVHVYIDRDPADPEGNDKYLLKGLLADQYRADVGNHAFGWIHPPFGAGTHHLEFFALGVDANGQFNGENILIGARNLDMSCQNLFEHALGWCQGNPAYFINRQKDTILVGNESVRVGVDLSYGGTILQVYGQGWDKNYVLEHGGGAVQLSFYGYDMVGPAAYFAKNTGGPCDDTAYTYDAGGLAACQAGGRTCIGRSFSQGRHVVNCDAGEYACGGSTPGDPWNPIQAQGFRCGWDDASNDVAAHEWIQNPDATRTFYTKHDYPNHFFTSKPPPAMDFEQWVTAYQGYAKVQYRLRYVGSDNWSLHNQEMPALFTAFGMDKAFYFYSGVAPFTDASVQRVEGHPGGAAVDMTYHLPGRPDYGWGACLGILSEGWWSVCNQAEDQCLTVAAFDDAIKTVSLLTFSDSSSAYITPMGSFAVSPGFEVTWTIFMFPYRYDQMIGNQSVRQIIYSLAPDSFKNLPRCQQRQCGPDNCGGSCGSCGNNESCDGNGQCVCSFLSCNNICCAQAESCYNSACCARNCTGKECGSDGCGGSCGNCGNNESCDVSGQCACSFVSCNNACCGSGEICYNNACCLASCVGKECGSDGCGGSCGSCTGTDVCNQQSGQCEPGSCTKDCTGRQCGPDPVCSQSCGDCASPQTCDTSGQCVCPNAICQEVCCQPGQICFQGACCGKNCAGRECGSDSCGGNCGTCPDTEVCNLQSGQCEPGSCTKDCTDRQCGPDPVCGQSCGDCESPSTCNANGSCEALPGNVAGSCGCSTGGTEALWAWLLAGGLILIRRRR